MDVRLPDGRILKNVPEGTTRAQIEAKIGAVSAPVEAAPAEQPEPNLWQQARPYIAPVAETVGLIGGAIAGGGAGTLAAPGPGTVAGGVAGAGLGYGMARQLMEAGDVYLGGKTPQAPAQQAAGAAKDVLTGAALESGGRALLPVAGKALMAIPGVKTAGEWFIDTTSGAIVQIKAGKVLRQIAGDKLPQVRQALQNADDPAATAGQLVANAHVNAPVFQAMEAKAASKLPTEFSDVYRAQEATRTAALESVTPNLAASEAWRTSVSRPLYQQADAAQAPIDANLMALMERPAIAEAMRAAANTARNQNVPFITANGQLTGRGAHIVKLELDAMGRAGPNNPASDVARTAAQTAGRDFLGWLQTSIPTYGQARAAYARTSPSVNQSNLLGELTSILQKPGGGERPSAFLNALGRGEDTVINRLVRRDGTPRFDDIKAALTPDQAAAVGSVENQLGRNIQMRESATEGGQALNEILRISGEPVQSPGWFSAVVTAVNTVAKKLQGKVNDKTITMLSEGMLSNKSALEILNSVPAKDRNAVIQAFGSISNARKVTGTYNALAPQNQNALTP